ncbi:MAG: PD-(D/E)XK nuclease family protein, partial [Turicibacter sp.]
AAYSDIAIYTNEASAYYELFNAIFPKFNIPIFLDYTEPMIHHPLMTLLYHVMDTFINQWRYESLFTVIKTGLLMNIEQITSASHYYKAFQDYQRQIDVLENYCLARNINKKQWTQNFPWEYNRYQGLSRGYAKTDEDVVVEKMLNRLKVEIYEQLSPFETELKQATTYLTCCEAIFTFLERCQIPQKLKFLEESATSLDDLKQVKQHQQVWNKILALFEQIVEIGGDEAVTLENFATVFKAGLEEMSYATVPARLDQVYIGECRRARYQLTPDLHDDTQFGIKHAFLIGVNEGQVPKIPTESSLLNEVEREQLREMGIELAASLEQSLADEMFILYTVLTSPKETLTLSYVSSNDDGKEFLASHIYTHLREMFPKALEAHITRMQVNDVYDHLTTLNQSVPQVIAALKQDPELKGYYQPLLDYYKDQHVVLSQLVDRILHYDNAVKPLDANTTRAIYTEEIAASVSRIELFNQCEFAHYVRYGLQLKEREAYKVDLPQIGELYHEALKRIAVLIQKENRTFADLSVDECLTLSRLTADELSDKLLYKILKQNRRMLMLKEKLTQVVYKTLVGLKYQSKKSDFKPLFFELPFQKNAKSGINIKPKSLPNGYQLALKGVIDRIDVAKPAGRDEAYLRIVDYKSSDKKIELDKVYYGLSLQLLTYLDVAVSNALQLIEIPAEVGGMLYFHVHRPFLSEDKTDILRHDQLSEELATLEMKEYKMSGYLPKDLSVAHLSDITLEHTLKSDILQLTIKKDGQFSSVGNSVLPPTAIETLREYTNQTIIQSATKITEGQIDINPVQHGTSKACDYCQYHEICQYDADFRGNQKRQLPKLKSEIALTAMIDSINQEEEEELS